MRRSVRAVLACCALSVVVVAAGALAGPASTGRNARDAAGPGRAGSGIRGSLGAILHAEAEGLEDGTPEDWVLAQRSSGGTPSIRAFNEASNESAAIGRETRQTAPKVARAQWTFLGPTNIGGRVLDIAVDPAHADTVFIATATGGVWKTTDAGVTFQRAWPQRLTQSIGAVAFGSDGILYAGTGEAGPGGGSITYGGNGMYRSADFGVTWTHIGLGNSGAISRIAVDPTNPQRVFVAAAGSLFVPGHQRGVYRSVDGGAHWQRVLAPVTSTSGAADLSMDPTNPQKLYATMWDHIRHPNLRVYGGTGSGAYRSTDGGTTWELMPGLPHGSSTVGRIGLGVSRSNPSRLYAIAITWLGFFQGMYTSSNGGTSWSALPNDSLLSSSQSSYGWWFGRVWVDPVVEQHVYAAGVNLMESLNGGQSWTPHEDPHADQHAMAWDPASTGRVYLGNDGGVYVSQTNGVAGGWTHASVEPFTQFYTLDVSVQDPTRLVGGAQDNGANRSYTGTAGGTADGWSSYVGGDGTQSLIDPANQNNVYGCSQYGSCSYSRDGGDTTSRFGSTTSTRRNWLVPIVFDPNNTQVMYYGGNRLNRSTNGAQAWTVISPDLTGGPGPDTQYPWGTLTAIAVSASNPNELFVGTDDGRVWFTMDLGANWTQVTASNLPSAWVTRMAIDPADAQVAYATFSGFRSGNNAANVFRTADGGATWTSIGAGLPHAPVNDIVLAGGTIYTATDVGVFLTRDVGAHWLRLGKGLPLVPITDIRVIPSAHALFAATFGRGMYRVPLPA
ncbi:MAG TPA: glycosyl hydrolase [Actinomycetota bacterium]